MNALTKFDNWHKTKRGYAVMAVIELVLAYIVGSRSLDTGSWWQYGFTLILFIGGVQNLYQFIRKK